MTGCVASGAGVGVGVAVGGGVLPGDGMGGVGGNEFHSSPVCCWATAAVEATQKTAASSVRMAIREGNGRAPVYAARISPPIDQTAEIPMGSQ